MEKILVTTDLSVNSLAGIRFAIQLASRRDMELVFFHANDLWDDTEYRDPDKLALLAKEKETIQNRLKSLVEASYKTMQVHPGTHQVVCYFHMGVINSILHYATHNDCDYICISTHGAGNVLALMGSITSELISESDIPVLCVPQRYEPQPVETILYASDMADHKAELARVVAFAAPMNAHVQVLNFIQPGMAASVGAKNNAHSNGGHISYIYEENEKKSLADNLDEVILKYSPSMLVMFTNQDRNLLELLFDPSQTQKYSFRTKIPLLAIPKRIK
jgi:Universal stress protein UspA and related nucleotide-binding proteins